MKIIFTEDDGKFKAGQRVDCLNEWGKQKIAEGKAKEVRRVVAKSKATLKRAGQSGGQPEIKKAKD